MNNKQYVWIQQVILEVTGRHIWITSLALSDPAHKPWLMYVLCIASWSVTTVQISHSGSEMDSKAQIIAGCLGLGSTMKAPPVVF